MKNKNGITLIALVITIIVLLILAGVSISLVMGDNGILKKAQGAVNKYSEAEIVEQIKLAYSAYQMAKAGGTSETAQKFIEDRLKEAFEDENLTVNTKNDKVVVNTIVNSEPKIFIYKPNTGESYEYIDPFDYGTKTRETLAPGDDITLGTEKFMVFSKTDTEIKAMPYYNLVTVTADSTVRQGPAVSGVSTEISSKFSTGSYWPKGEDAVDMADSRNLIQQYIMAYKTTLERTIKEGIEVRAAKNSELNSAGVTNIMRNPGQLGTFWLGSGSTQYAYGNRIITDNASGYLDEYNGACDYNSFGIRPIIIIQLD